MSSRPQLGYSLTRHGDGWRVRVYGGLNPDTGKPRQLSRVFTASTERQAHRQAQAIAAELRGQVAELAERRGTVAELADDWLALKRRQGRSAVTLEGYAHWCVRIVERFGRVPVAELTGRDIDRWYGELIDSGAGVPTVHHLHAVLRGMMRQAVRWEMVDHAATDRVSLPSAPRSEVRPPTVDQLATMLEVVPTELRHMLELAALTGMRRGELCGLWWSDIDGATLTVRRSVVDLKGARWEYKPGGKTGRVRSLSIGASTLAVLEAQRAHLTGMAESIGVPLELAGDRPVFPHLAADVSGGTPRRPAWVSATWRALRVAHGLERVRVHDLRHLNVTVGLQAGVPVRTMADRAGHSRPSITTDVYGHGTDEAAELAVQVIDERIGRRLRPE